MLEHWKRSDVQRLEKKVIQPNATSAKFSLGGEYVICKPGGWPQMRFAQMLTFQSILLAVEL